MVIVQHIETTWYKNERGAMHGTLRGKTPEAILIPTDDITANREEMIVHTVQYGRTTTETREKLEIRAGKNLHIGCLCVEPSESTALVDFTWDYRSGGKPIRWQTGRKSWTLNENQWCRIRYNGRLVLEHTWQYKITTLNIGIFEEIIRDCFVETTPDYCFENMVRLW